MARVVNLFYWLLLAAFVLEFSLGISISRIPGLSLKNIAIYCLIIAMFFVNPAMKRPVIELNRVGVSIILFILYCFASLIATAMFRVVPDYSLGSQFIQFKSYMDPYVLFIITFSILHDERSIKRLIGAMVVVLVVFIVITLLSSFDIWTVKRVTVDERWGRTKGAFAEANQFAAYLSMFVPLVGSFILTSRSRLMKIALVGVLLAVFYVLLMTGSRGGLVAVAVAIGSYYLLYSRQPLSKSLLNLAGIYIVGLILLTILFFMLPEQTEHGLMLKLSGKFVEETNTDYSSGRLEVWGAALSAFIHTPLFGTGWETFRPLFHLNSHSDYILFLVTTGVVGLYLFLRIYVGMFRMAMRWRKEDPGNIHYYNAYISGLSAFMVALAFVNIYSPSYFVLLYSALVLRLGAVSSRDSVVVPERMHETSSSKDGILRRRDVAISTQK